jgi:hypothetical protein
MRDNLFLNFHPNLLPLLSVIEASGIAEQSN